MLNSLNGMSLEEISKGKKNNKSADEEEITFNEKSSKKARPKVPKIVWLKMENCSPNVLITNGLKL